MHFSAFTNETSHKWMKYSEYIYRFYLHTHAPCPEKTTQLEKQTISPLRAAATLRLVVGQLVNDPSKFKYDAGVRVVFLGTATLPCSSSEPPRGLSKTNCR